MSPRDDDFFGWTNRLEKYGWTTSGGNITLGPALNPANLKRPVAYEFLSEWESLTPRTVEWQVNVQSPKDSDGFYGFPPSRAAVQYTAGAHFDGPPTYVWNAHGEGCVVCRLELGSGPNARTIFSDLRSGRFALGVQTRVRVSVARWLVGEGDPNAYYDIQSSVAEAHATDADPPTYTAAIAMNPGAQQAKIIQPPGALWFDAFGLGLDMLVEISTGNGSFFKSSNYTPDAICHPGSPPWPAPLYPQFTVKKTSPTIAHVFVRWWVR